MNGTPNEIPAIAAAIRNGTTSAREHIGALLDRIDRLNPALNAYREVFHDHARETAERIDDAVASGEDAGRLAGIAVAVKDNIVTRIGRTTCGSRMLQEYQSPFDATAVARLQDAGAIVIGKTNCDEFGMGSSSEHCAYGVVRNPWDQSRVPGGSSGGSAAAVAAELCDVALGSDTGGSIRQPAALCGVVGIKPSYGRVSRLGLVAFGSSLDQIGPLARSARDAAEIMAIIEGVDDGDVTSANEPANDYSAAISSPIDPHMRLGVCRRDLDACQPATRAAIEQAIADFQESGAEIIEIDLPMAEYGIATYYIVAPAEASSNLARFDGIRYGRRCEPRPGDDLEAIYARSRSEGLGPEVQRRIMLGTYVLSAGYADAYYKRALRTRRLIREDYDRAFEKCHAIIGSTSPDVAFQFAAHDEPMSMYACDRCTVNANMAGICAMSVPCGFVEANGAPLPIGMQIQCPAFEEARMLHIACAFEDMTSHHTRRPSVTPG